MGDDSESGHEVPLLPPFVRWATALLGVALLVGGGLVLIAPPHVRSFAPQCAAADCIASVQQPADLTATAIIGFGVLLVILGANGRHITGLKIGSAEASMDASEKDAQAKEALAEDIALSTAAAEPEADSTPALEPGEGPGSLISVAGAELVRVEASQVPAKVLSDLALSGIPVRSSAEVAWGARRLGQGNNPWYVQLRNGRTFKISYGGQSKAEPTVSELN